MQQIENQRVQLKNENYDALEHSSNRWIKNYKLVNDFYILKSFGKNQINLTCWLLCVYTMWLARVFLLYTKRATEQNGNIRLWIGFEIFSVGRSISNNCKCIPWVPLAMISSTKPCALCKIEIARSWDILASKSCPSIAKIWSPSSKRPSLKQ